MPAVSRNLAVRLSDAPRDGLNGREKRFVEEYLRGVSATEAARRAGYEGPNVRITANALLKRKRIAHAILGRQHSMAERYEVTTEKIVRELSFLAFSNMGDFVRIDEYGNATVDLSGCTKEQLAAVEAIVEEEEIRGEGEDQYVVRRTKIKLRDKRGALGDLAKLLGLLKGAGDDDRGQPYRATFEFSLSMGNAQLSAQGPGDTAQATEVRLHATVALPEAAGGDLRSAPVFVDRSIDEGG